MMLALWDAIVNAAVICQDDDDSLCNASCKYTVCC